MRNNHLRRLFGIGLIMLGIATTAVAQEVRTFEFGHNGKNGIKLTEQTRGNVGIEFNISEMSLQSFTYKGEELQSIGISGISLPNEKGLPNVPAYSRYIAVPQGAEAVLRVVSYEQQTIKDVNIEPSLGVQAEDAEPDMNYVKDEKVYSQDAFYPSEFATVSEPTSLRGVDVVALSISPVRFNPVSKEAIVYHNIEIEVEFIGGNGQFGDDRLRSPYWDPILAQNVMNYNTLPVIDYEKRMQDWVRDGAEGAEYLIVIPNNDDFEAPAERIREYRMQQGIITEVVRLDEIPATTTAQMKSYFHNAYNTWEIAPVAVMLLADHNTNMTQGIPAETVSHPYEGSCISDNQYADVTGDHLPEMVFSRLVAANGTEAVMMVDKQIEYEFTNPNMDAHTYNVPVTALGWQTERWFQLCSEVVGGYFRAHGKNPYRINCIYDGTPGSVWSSATNTSQVVSYFGPSGTGYIPQTPSEIGGFTGGQPEQINEAINAGTMIVQHRDHGLETGWGEPEYRNNNVSQLTNVGKMTFVMSINCLTGKFNNNSPCFAETFIRHTYNGQNAGAVGLLCPTEVSYSFVNDAYVWGVYDQFQPDFMPDYGPYAPQQGNWQPAFGNVAGKYFLAQSSWPYNYESKDITYQMFTAHCDAFLRLYTEVPQTMTVNHQQVQIAGLTTFQITAPEGTKIALTKGEGENLEIIAVAEATGSMQNIEIPSQTPPTIIKLTVTGQNYIRYQADVEVVPAEGPYVIVNSFSLSNGATQLNFSDEADFDIVLKNVGVETAPAGTATISTDSEYVTITNPTVDFTSIAADATTNIAEAFGFTVSNNVPNNTAIAFTVNIESGGDEYESHINVKAYAPIFEIGNVSIEEISGNGNGRLDPGETAKLIFPIENKGGAVSAAVNATLVINNSFMQLTSGPTVTVGSIENGGNATVEYVVNVGAAPSGFAAEYTLDIESGAYDATRDFTSKIGLNVEDFEAGELNADLWSNDNTKPWTFETNDPYEGTYCMKSGQIGNNGSTTLTLYFEVGEADSIAFYYKVSSESGYDKLYFSIDNSEKGNWSGNIGWTRAQFYVTAGSHTFKWKYQKDFTTSSGSDCCWIDFVILPRDNSMTVSAGLDIDACPAEPAQINGYAQNYESLEWTTSGDGTFSSTDIANPVYTAGQQDIANGQVTLTITGIDSSSNVMTDDAVLTFLPATEISTLTAPESVCYNESIDVAATVNAYESVEWTTSGDGTFEKATELSTTYIPGENDINNGTVTLTINAIGCNEVSESAVIAIIGLPAISVESEMSVCKNVPVAINPTASNYESVEWTTSGDGTFNDATSLNTTYIPGEEDIADGNVTLSITATGCETVEAFINVTIIDLPQLAMPSGPTDVYNYQAVTEYTVEANEMFTSYVWNVEPESAASKIDVEGNKASITWNMDAEDGEVALTVSGVYEACGESAPSDALIITLKGHGMEEINATAMNIFPNPTDGNISISIANVNSNVKVTVYNTIGEVVHIQEVAVDNGLNMNIDLSKLANGTYFVSVKDNGNVWMQKIVVKR